MQDNELDEIVVLCWMDFCCMKSSFHLLVSLGFTEDI